MFIVIALSDNRAEAKREKKLVKTPIIASGEYAGVLVKRPHAIGTALPRSTAAVDRPTCRLRPAVSRVRRGGKVRTSRRRGVGDKRPRAGEDGILIKKKNA